MIGKKIIALASAFCLSTTALLGASFAKESKTIVIGGNFELSGTLASYGQASVNGIKMAVDEVNKAGGILGKKVLFIPVDNKSDSQETVSVAKKLISNDNVSAIIGPVSSGGTKAEKEVCEKYKVPLISGTATEDGITLDKSGKVMDYIFRTCYKDSFQGSVMAKYVKEHPELKIKKVVILMDNTSDYSKGLAKYFSDTFTKGGGKIISTEGYSGDQSDFKAVLVKVKGENPDAIYLPTYYQTAGKMVNQARGLGINCPILGCDGFDSEQFAKIAGKSNLKNIYFTDHYSTDIATPEAKAFRKNYNAKYHTEPNALSALNYDTAKFVMEGMKKAGSTDSAKLIKALASVKNFKGVTGQFSIDKDHNTIKDAVIITMNGDKQKYVTTVRQ